MKPLSGAYGAADGAAVCCPPWGSLSSYPNTAIDRSPLQGHYFSGDGARRDEDGYYWITGALCLLRCTAQRDGLLGCCCCAAQRGALLWCCCAGSACRLQVHALSPTPGRLLQQTNTMGYDASLQAVWTM